VRLVQEANLFYTQIIEQFYMFLVFSWGIIILLGNFVALFLIAVGFVSWLSDWHPIRGKRMIIGGILLFLIMQWMAVSSPMMFTFVLS
jgi:hypothetical protein